MLLQYRLLLSIVCNFRYYLYSGDFQRKILSDGNVNKEM